MSSEGSRSASPAAPFLLSPIAVPRVWGGRRLLTEIHPSLTAPVDDAGNPLPIGETWEVSDVDDDPALHSVITTGPHAGETLRSLLRADPTGVLGAAGIAHDLAGEIQLPLLFKFIDAREDLSVQVHPSDELLAARGLPGRGKSEAWVILDAAPGSRLIVGFEEGWDFERYLASVRDGGSPVVGGGAVEGSGVAGLRSVEVTRGDIVELPAGLVHAIGGGILLAEIQQSSDITWRLYDWGRVGLDGAPRQLHLDDCDGIIPPDPAPPCPLSVSASEEKSWARAIDGEHFRLEVFRGDPEGAPCPIGRRGDRFGLLALLEGEDVVLSGADVGLSAPLPLRPGAVAFVPANASETLEIRSRGPIWALWMEPGDPRRD